MGTVHMAALVVIAFGLLMLVLLWLACNCSD
jgi:hypothetical protein